MSTRCCHHRGPRQGRASRQRAHEKSLCRHRGCRKQLPEPHTVAGHGEPTPKFREQQQQRQNQLSGNHGCHITCNLQTLETAFDVEGIHKEWCFLCQRNRRRACVLWISEDEYADNR